MLRLASLLLILSAAITSAEPVPKVKVKDEDAVLGQWKLVELTHGGVATKQGFQDSITTLEKGKMSAKAPGREDRDEAMAYKLDADKKQIDLSPKVPGADVEVKGIYELDGDTLIIVLGMGGNAERPKEAKFGPGVTYLKLQRIKEEKK